MGVVCSQIYTLRRKAETFFIHSPLVSPHCSSISPVLKPLQQRSNTFSSMPVIIPDDTIDDEIYTGFWVNQAYGPLRGACLTLGHQAGGLIIAFLALFITTASRSAWKIVCFLLHAAYATPTAQDGLHLQRQILLRNNSLPIATAVSMLRACIVWRNRAAEVKQKTLSVAVYASAVTVMSAAAGAFC